MLHDLAAKHDIKAVVGDLFPVIAIGQHQIDVFSRLHINSEIIPAIGNDHGTMCCRVGPDNPTADVQDIQRSATVWSEVGLREYTRNLSKADWCMELT